MTSKRVVTALPGEQTISYTREFEAPAALVFRAHTEADLVSKWTGPAGTEVRTARAVADELRAAVIESQVAVADPVAGVQTAPAVAAGL